METIDDEQTQQPPAVSDAEMRQLLAASKPYTAMLLRTTDKAEGPDAPAVIWEHGRRNMALRAAGRMPIVCPVTDESELAGVAIFDATPEEVIELLEEDPGVQAGIFTYELHPVFGFPGSTL